MYKHEQITLPHAKISVAHLNFSPRDPTVLLCPGWGESIEVLKYSMDELEKLNRPVIALEHPKDFKPIDNPTKHSQRQYQKAINIHHVIERLNLKSVDIVAHSEGAINGIIAASLSPKIIRSITMLNPSGIIEHKSTLNFSLTMIKKILSDAARAAKFKKYRSVFKKHTTLGKKHGIVSFDQLKDDASYASRVTIHGLIEELSKNNIYIAVVAGKDDVIYPAEEVKSSLDHDYIDTYIEVDGWHDELHYNPKKYADIIESILKNLNS